jgi:hypothetical protein
MPDDDRGYRPGCRRKVKHRLPLGRCKPSLCKSDPARPRLRCTRHQHQVLRRQRAILDGLLALRHCRDDDQNSGMMEDVEMRIVGQFLEMVRQEGSR